MAKAKKSAITEYLAEISKQLATGHAAEHAYRPALKTLMEQIGDVDAVNDPKRSEHGAPDFVFLRRGAKDLILGWAEAKDITGNLDKIEKSEQLQRYAGYPNLFLTNYLEFRFYSNGNRYSAISLGELKGGKVESHPDNFQAISDELEQFLGREPEPVVSGVQLAEVMGAKARRIRDNVHQYLEIQGEKKAELLNIFHLIRETLVHDIDKARFSDMYAQTLVYGLFAARFNDTSPDDFTRAEARDLVPPSNPFLRQFFDHIAGANFDSRLAYIVDELCEVFRVSDVRSIVHKHLAGPEDDRDPIIHFYEDFLKSYDPDQRKRMGAYYTPLPIVRFMIRMVDGILKDEFELPSGIADTSKTKIKKKIQGKNVEEEIHKVQILDPAVGTATFLNEIVKHILSGFTGQEGRWPAYAKDDLIPRLHGFELMMAPYTVAHLKLGLTLKESGVDDFGQRLGVYLTNTLEQGMDRPQTLFQQPGLAGAVATEAIEAGEIKNERPIMIVIGNPPYSGISSNETPYANALIDSYKVEPGGKIRLQERKHWLNDDYVKFIAFAESMIEKGGSGVVAMITNHGFLDNPTFRGMRWRLSRTFDQISVLDLHGNAKRQEAAVDGSKDENVFAIQQGVAIMIATRYATSHNDAKCEIRRGDLYGTRRAKLDTLDADSVVWRPIELAEAGGAFVETNSEGRDEYLDGVRLDELFPVNVTGIVTARDSVVIDMDRAALEARIEKFRDPAITDDATRAWLFPNKKNGKYLAGDSRGWKLTSARKLVAGEPVSEMIAPLTYRPFDQRFIYYSPSMVDWPRKEVMPHFLHGENLALISVRRVPDSKDAPYVFATSNMVVNGSIRSDSVSIDSAFPLYIFEPEGRRDNLDPAAVKRLLRTVSGEHSPEDILDYVYGALHSPAYRAKYSEFLRTDFPRVPLPRDDAEFNHFVRIGNRLRELHLMRSDESLTVHTKYQIGGDNSVEKVEFDSGKVYINATQFFEGVSESAWVFSIGGYRPAQKWLKDRKGRRLSNQEIEHFQRIITVLEKTGEIMREIDDPDLDHLN